MVLIPLDPFQESLHLVQRPACELQFRHKGLTFRLILIAMLLVLLSLPLTEESSGFKSAGVQTTAITRDQAVSTLVEVLQH